MPLRDDGGIPIPVSPAPSGTDFVDVFGDIQPPEMLVVVRVDQEKDAWCYAACAEMIINTLRGLLTVEKCAVASFVKSTLLVQVDCCANGNSPACSESGCTTQDFNFIFAEPTLTGNNPITGHPNNPLGPVSLIELQREFDNRRPVLVRIKWNDMGAHAVVVTAVAGTQVHVIDPLQDGGHGGWHELGFLRIGFGQGTWTETWIELK